MKTKLPTHVYRPDPGITDRRGGVDGCQHCPRSWRGSATLPAAD